MLQAFVFFFWQLLESVCKSLIRWTLTRCPKFFFWERCTNAEKLLANVCVPSKRNLQQKQKLKITQIKDWLVGSGRKPIFRFLLEFCWNSFDKLCSFSDYLKFAQSAGCLHLWIFDDSIIRFCKTPSLEKMNERYLRAGQ